MQIYKSKNSPHEKKITFFAKKSKKIAHAYKHLKNKKLPVYIIPTKKVTTTTITKQSTSNTKTTKSSTPTTTSTKQSTKVTKKKKIILQKF